MGAQVSLLLLATVSQGVFSYPHIAQNLASHIPAKDLIERQLGGGSPGFNAQQQYVSNQGEHAFIAPGSGDARGPCPGLNAMANHNYIPRNGVGTISQFVDGTFQVFGMGRDLGGFLSILGAGIDGDGQKWSIGGPHPDVGLGATGLIGSHNKYECDVSPVRPDLYLAGNNFKVNTTQFKQLYDMQAGVSAEAANYDLDILRQHRSNRFTASINDNPYFFNGPFTGVAVQPAAYTFIFRFMGNKSAEFPEGRLNKNVLKSFFGVTENSDGSFTVNPGGERIPDNWYKRAIGDEYTISRFGADLIAHARQDPRFLNVGGNTGKTNTFTGIDFSNFSGGIFNLRTLLEGNNAFCFAYQFAAQAQPDFLTTLLKTALGVQVVNSILSLGCPQLAKFEEDMLKQFPGYQS